MVELAVLLHPARFEDGKDWDEGQRLAPVMTQHLTRHPSICSFHRCLVTVTARACGGNGYRKTINGVSAPVCQGELPRERTDGHCPARAPEKLVQGGILEPVSSGFGQQGWGPGATSAVVSVRLPRRGLVLGLDCRPQLARWSQLPTTGERIQEN